MPSDPSCIQQGARTPTPDGVAHPFLLCQDKQDARRLCWESKEVTLQHKWIIHATVQDVLLHVSQHLDLLPKAQSVDLGELPHDLLIPVLNHTRVTP